MPKDDNILEKGLKSTNDFVDEHITKSLGGVTDTVAKKYASLGADEPDPKKRNMAKRVFPWLGAAAVTGVGVALLQPINWLTKSLFSVVKNIVTGFGLLPKIPLIGGLFKALGDGVEKIGEYAGYVVPAIAGFIGYKALQSKQGQETIGNRTPFEKFGDKAKEAADEYLTIDHKGAETVAQAGLATGGAALIASRRTEAARASAAGSRESRLRTRLAAVDTDDAPASRRQQRAIRRLMGNNNAQLIEEAAGGRLSSGQAKAIIDYAKDARAEVARDVRGSPLRRVAHSVRHPVDTAIRTATGGRAGRYASQTASEWRGVRDTATGRATTIIEDGAPAAPSARTTTSSGPATTPPTRGATTATPGTPSPASTTAPAGRHPIFDLHEISPEGIANRHASGNTPAQPRTAPTGEAPPPSARTEGRASPATPPSRGNFFTGGIRPGFGTAGAGAGLVATGMVLADDNASTSDKIVAGAAGGSGAISLVAASRGLTTTANGFGALASGIMVPVSGYSTVKSIQRGDTEGAIVNGTFTAAGTAMAVPVVGTLAGVSTVAWIPVAGQVAAAGALTYVAGKNIYLIGKTMAEIEEVKKRMDEGYKATSKAHTANAYVHGYLHPVLRASSVEEILEDKHGLMSDETKEFVRNAGIKDSDIGLPTFITSVDADGYRHYRLDLRTEEAAEKARAMLKRFNAYHKKRMDQHESILPRFVTGPTGNWRYLVSPLAAITGLMPEDGGKKNMQIFEHSRAEMKHSEVALKEFDWHLEHERKDAQRWIDDHEKLGEAEKDLEVFVVEVRKPSDAPSQPQEAPTNTLGNIKIDNNIPTIAVEERQAPQI